MLHSLKANVFLRGMLACFFALACAAQNFDVVSVKYSGTNVVVMHGPGKQVSIHTENFRYSGTRLTCELPLRAIVREAYSVKDLQIDAPEWLGAEIYRVDAVMPEGTTKEEAHPMLRKMLADRFGLRLHREQKDVPVYALVEAKDGFKLHAINDPDHPTQRMMETPGGTMVRAASIQTSGQYTAVSTSIDDFANWLRLQVDRPVVNFTNTQGVYEVDLHWTPEVPKQPADAELLRTIERKMGLKLEARKMPFEVLVIDHAERVPIPN